VRTAAVLAPLVAVTLLQGCSLGTTDVARPNAAPPAEVVQIEGTDRSIVTLTEDAEQRLGIKTETARYAVGSSLIVVPVDALIYDVEGQTWVYTTTEPRTFFRQAVTVARIEGDDAILQSGLASGAPVVIVGGAELLGAEYGVEGE
jgi:hypothetical protein